MIKAVIFDMDGTVTDTLSTIAYFGNFALKKNGFEPIDEAEYKYFAGNGKKILIRRMLDYGNNYTPDNYKRVEKTYDDAYERDTVGKTTVFDGILPLLEKLHQNGIKTAVNSNKPDNVAVAALNKIFPKGSFDDACGQKEDVPIKPDPTAALRLAAEFGAKPGECVFVGDTSVDIETAKNAGMHSIGVLWGFRDFSELHEAGAEYIAEKPEEIWDIILKIESEKTRDN